MQVTSTPVTPRRSKACKVRLEEGLHQLAGAVLAEIEVDDLIAVLDQLGAVDDGGADELVVLALGIGQIDGGGGVRGVPALAVHQAAPGDLGAVPAVVAVHRPIAPGDRGDLPARGRQGLFQAGQEGLSGARRGVAPVSEAMEHRPRALAPAQLDQCDGLVHMAVHPAVRDQPHQVHRPALVRGGAGGGGQHRVVVEAAVRDGGVDQYQVLLDHAA